VESWGGIAPAQGNTRPGAPAGFQPVARRLASDRPLSALEGTEGTGISGEAALEHPGAERNWPDSGRNFHARNEGRVFRGRLDRIERVEMGWRISLRGRHRKSREARGRMARQAASRQSGRET